MLPPAPTEASTASRRVRAFRTARASSAFAGLSWLLLALPAQAQPAPPIPGPGAAPAPKLVPPVVVKEVAPVAPADLVLDQPAEVVLLVTIDEHGKVLDESVVASASAALDLAAKEAAHHWEFQPATRDGLPVSSRIKVSLRFPARKPPRPAEVPLHGTSAATEGEHQHTPESPPATDGGADTVFVRGHVEAPSRGSGDYQIRVGKLAEVPKKDAAELLKLAPGVFLTNAGGSGHPYQIFLRGFDAREGQDIEFSVGGVPINEVGNVHGNGLADTHFLLPELVDSLRVTEGPFAPQQGNFAVAGSASYEVGLARRGMSLSTTLGSFGTKRVLLLWGPEGQSIHTFGGVELFQTDGFGQARSGQRASAMGGYEGRVGKTATYRLLVQSYAAHYAMAGLLRADDVAAGRKGFYDTYDPEQGGDSTRHSVGLRIDDVVGNTDVSQSLFFILRDFRLRQNFTGFLLDRRSGAQSPHDQRGDLLDQHSDAKTLGARGSARTHFTLFDQKHDIELGYFGRYDDVDSTSQRIRNASPQAPYKRLLDLSSALTNIALYADANLRPHRKVSIRGGVRGDYFAYDVQNHCALTAPSAFGGDTPDTECFTQDRAGYRSPDQRTSTGSSLVQPRATVLVGPFDGFTFSSSWGQGARSLDPQYVAQGYDTPFARVTSMEAGVSFNKEVYDIDLSARSTFFRTHVDRDLFFNETEGRNTLAGGTSRNGWTGLVRATGSFFDVSVNGSLVRATFDDTHLLIPYVPDVVTRGDLALFTELPVHPLGQTVRASAGFGGSFVGRRALPYDQRSDSIFVLDASARLATKFAELALTGTNLADRQYRSAEYNFASDFRSAAYPTLVASRHFNAGEPRALYATLTLRWENHGAN
jgi:iron complex outermembrane recepter protein